MNKLMNKKLTKKGFTLAELLIVVAILAILVAVSIPIFTSKLHDAKDSTDMANERAAKAAAVAAYMSADEPGGTATYWYDAENGKVVASATKPTSPAINGYNQCTDKTCTDGAGRGQTTDPTADSLIVKIEIANNGTAITTSWA